MLRLLSEIYETFPEAGRCGFNQSFAFSSMKRIWSFQVQSMIYGRKLEAIVKLIRSKGVGVLFFLYQSPTDVPRRADSRAVAS